MKCACPYCHLGPCIISRCSSFLVGSSSPGLGNLAKLYEIFARCFISSCEEPSLIFGSVGSSHSVTDVLEVMPKFVVTVSLLLFCT